MKSLLSYITPSGGFLFVSFPNLCEVLERLFGNPYAQYEAAKKLHTLR